MGHKTAEWIPNATFAKLYEDVSKAREPYGELENHKNEEAISRFTILASVSGQDTFSFTHICCCHVLTLILGPGLSRVARWD